MIRKKSCRRWHATFTSKSTWSVCSKINRLKKLTRSFQAELINMSAPILTCSSWKALRYSKWQLLTSAFHCQIKYRASGVQWVCLRSKRLIEKLRVSRSSVTLSLSTSTLIGGQKQATMTLLQSKRLTTNCNYSLGGLSILISPETHAPSTTFATSIWVNLTCSTLVMIALTSS